MNSVPPICWQPTDIDRCVVLEPDITLDAATYRQFSDDLVKFAVGQPRAVIVRVDRMTIASEPVLTAFTTAWLRTLNWPCVPFLLVTEDAELQRRLGRSAVHRFLSVQPTVAAAVAAAAEPPSRRRTDLTVALSPVTGHRVRRLIDDTCADWGIADISEVSQIIATEFIDNADLHGLFTGVPDIDVRLEFRDDLLTIAIADPDPHEAVLMESVPGADGHRMHGLHIVAALASAWGCVLRWPTGKVVWATLATARVD